MLEDGEQKIKRLKVKNVMSKEPFLVNAEWSIKDPVIAMDRSGRSCLLETPHKKFVEIVTGGDTARVMEHRGYSKNQYPCPRAAPPHAENYSAFLIWFLRKLSSARHLNSGF